MSLMATLRLLAFVLAAMLGVATSAQAAPPFLIGYDYDGAANVSVATPSVVVPLQPWGVTQGCSIDSQFSEHASLRN